MLIRYRWFRIQLPARARDLASLFANLPFDLTSKCGFARIASNGSGASYRFFWRSQIVVTKLDAVSAPTYEQIESICFSDFAVINLGEMIFLRVENPGRNIRDLLNEIETLAGMGFTAKPVTFDKGRPATVFNSVDSSKLIGLKVTGTVLADDLVARMEFASKDGMVVENLAILAGLKYKVELAAFELVLGGLRGQLSFAANGTVKISGQIAPKLISLIEQDIPLLS